MSNKTLPGGTVYNLSIHLVLVTKYRRKVISPPVKQRLWEIFTEVCHKWDCALVEFNGEENHCHLLIDINPKVQISAFANNMKTISSRFIRREFQEHCNRFYSKPVFWKIGYFVSSTGGANLKTVKRYIQEQDRRAESDNCSTVPLPLLPAVKIG